MEDTRMDLSQLEESASRSVTHEASFAVAAPSSPPSAIMATATATTEVTAIEEQADFEGGADMEGDADAELDLLGEEDPEPREADQQVCAATAVPDTTPTSTASAPAPAPAAPVSTAPVTSTVPASSPASASAPSVPPVLTTSISEQSAAEKSQTQEAPLSFADVAGPSSSPSQPGRLLLR